jgi:hypothetical protein
LNWDNDIMLDTPPAADGLIDSAPSDTKRSAEKMVAIKKPLPPDNNLQCRGLRQTTDSNLHFQPTNLQPAHVPRTVSDPAAG